MKNCPFKGSFLFFISDSKKGGYYGNFHSSIGIGKIFHNVSDNNIVRGIYDEKTLRRKIWRRL